SLQRFDQAGGLHGCDERGVVLRVHRILDDILRGIHWSAADGDGLLLHFRACRCRRHGGEDKRRDGDRRRQSREFHVDAPCAVRRVSGLRMRYAARDARMQRTDIFRSQPKGRRAHKLVSLPLAMTGPVGCPVADPPGGSSDTASAASGTRRPTRSGGMVRRIGWAGLMRPSERGCWLGRISHSSMARGSLVSSVAGTTRRLSPVAVTVATKFGWPLLPASVAISGARVAGTKPK